MYLFLFLFFPKRYVFLLQAHCLCTNKKCSLGTAQMITVTLQTVTNKNTLDNFVIQYIALFFRDQLLQARSAPMIDV